ncbi:MAG: nuclear transport factor 2 family protein [Pseudomonadota bacterium]
MRMFLSTLALLGATATAALADPARTTAQVQTLFTALEQGDLDTVSSLMADDVVNTIAYTASGDTTPASQRVFDGKAAVMGYFEGARQLIPQVAFADTDITVSAAGDTAFVQNRGDMVLADGRTYRNLYVWRVDFEGGQIVEMTEYFNPVTAALAFGRPLGPDNATE